MAERKPLVNIDGQVQELPTGDSVILPTVTFTDVDGYVITQTSGIVVVLVNASANPLTIFTPGAANNTAIITVKKIDSSANVVSVSASDKIDNRGVWDLTKLYESVIFISDGSTWNRIAEVQKPFELTATQVLIDFERTPINEKTFVIGDTSLLTTSKLIINVVSLDDTEENSGVPLNLHWKCNAGSFNLTASAVFPNQNLQGTFKINYLVG